jgi:surface polysaccharide O-acyltransferase-like enzyme
MQNKKRNLYLFVVGIVLAVFMFISYFIKINVESGVNYNVQDSLLGIIIFHNPIVLALYLLISITLIYPFLHNNL